MSKLCANCGKEQPDQAIFCDGCGQRIVFDTAADATYPPRPAQQPVRKFSWIDVSTIAGFVSSIIGLFWCSIILLPLSAAASGVGFKGNKSKGLAVAGLVISTIGLLIRLCVLLYESGILPRWITGGVF